MNIERPTLISCDNKTCLRLRSVTLIIGSALRGGKQDGLQDFDAKYTYAATLDTEPLARSYSGGIPTRSSSNHFQSARSRSCSSIIARLTEHGLPIVYGQCDSGSSGLEFFGNQFEARQRLKTSYSVSPS